MKQKIKMNFMIFLPIFIAGLIGAVGGYMYYRLVGCVSGTCAITSNPYLSTLYGSVMAGLVGSLFITKRCDIGIADEQEGHYE